MRDSHATEIPRWEKSFLNYCDLYNSWVSHALYFCLFKVFHILKLEP